MTYYGLVTDVSKNKDTSEIYATIYLSTGKKIVVKSNFKTKPKDIVKVLMGTEGIEIEPISNHDEQKYFSARYGFLSTQKAKDGKPFSILEMSGGKTVGNIAHGHMGLSKQASMIGYGITNFNYFDETGKISKAINSAGIEGNVVWGTSLEKGNSLRFSISELTDHSYITMESDDLKKALKNIADSAKFLIDTIGAHGLLYIAGSSIYKIEGSGKKMLSNILSLDEIKFNNKTLKNSFSSLLQHINDKISIGDSLDFVIFLTKSGNGDNGTTNTKKITIKLFNKKYDVSEVKIHTVNKVYHYVNSMYYDGEEYHIDATDLIWAITNLKIKNGIYINPGNNKVSINNESLTMNAFKLINNITSSETIAQDKITLKVGQKGIKVDIAGASNI